MKSYRITVNGTTYDVTVEETGEVLQTVAFAEFDFIAGNQYYVPVTQIPPAYMQTIHTIEIYAGDVQVSSTATYSVESYVRLAINANNRFAPVALAGLKYGIAVAEFAAMY